MGKACACVCVRGAQRLRTFAGGHGAFSSHAQRARETKAARCCLGMCVRRALRAPEAPARAALDVWPRRAEHAGGGHVAAGAAGAKRAEVPARSAHDGLPAGTWASPRSLSLSPAAPLSFVCVCVAARSGSDDGTPPCRREAEERPACAAARPRPWLVRTGLGGAQSRHVPSARARTLPRALLPPPPPLSTPAGLPAPQPACLVRPLASFALRARVRRTT